MGYLYKKKKRKRLIVDFLITLMIILIADNPMVVGNKNVIIAFFVFLVGVFFFRRKKLDIQLLWVIVSVLLIILLQGLRWRYSFFTFFTYTVFTVLVPYLSIKIVGIRYLKYTSSIVYYASIISLVFFFGQVLIPGFTSVLLNIESLFRPFSSLPERPSIFIYSIAMNTIDQGSVADFLRNPGMFHEPGAFAVFIVLSIVINIYTTDNPFSKRNLVLLLALITTFSTAGFLAVFIVYGLYFFQIKRKNTKLLLAGSIIMLPLIIYVMQLPFMMSKIEDQVINQTSSSLTTETSGRILGARKAIVVLTRYPITGRGLIQASRETDFSSDEAAGYGFMKFFAEKGLIFSLLFLIFFIIGMKRISFFFTKDLKYWSLLGGSLLVNLFSQKFIGDTFFIMFFFIGILKEYSFENILKLQNAK